MQNIDCDQIAQVQPDVRSLMVRSTLFYFRLQVATYVLGGGVPNVWALAVFRAHFEVANQDGRVTPGEFSPPILSIFDSRASF